jgi:hypothetical protein
VNNEHCVAREYEPAADARQTKRDLIIRNQQFSSTHTSNDLWSRLNTEYPPKTMNYEVVAQNTDEVENIQNAPPVSMGAYLVDSDRTQLLTTISICSERRKPRPDTVVVYECHRAPRLEGYG